MEKGQVREQTSSLVLSESRGLTREPCSVSDPDLFRGIESPFRLPPFGKWMSAADGCRGRLPHQEGRVGKRWPWSVTGAATPGH